MRPTNVPQKLGKILTGMRIGVSYEVDRTINNVFGNRFLVDSSMGYIHKQP